MARYTGPQVKTFRREGINIFEPNTSKFKAWVKKNYPPGIHGQSSFGKQSEFAKQLREKQKGKKLYGLLEKQFKNYFRLALKSKDITGDALLKFCEKRLDNVVFRAGLARSRPHARQMTNHGLFRLNGRRVTLPSILVKKGDLIELKEKARIQKQFENLDQKKLHPPKWLSVDWKKMTIEVLSEPQADDLDKLLNAQLIVEFYSK